MNSWAVVAIVTITEKHVDDVSVEMCCDGAWPWTWCWGSSWVERVRRTVHLQILAPTISCLLYTFWLLYHHTSVISRRKHFSLMNWIFISKGIRSKNSKDEPYLVFPYEIDSFIVNSFILLIAQNFSYIHKSS